MARDLANGALYAFANRERPKPEWACIPVMGEQERREAQERSERDTIRTLVVIANAGPLAFIGATLMRLRRDREQRP
jgi:hypothetical protein